MRERVLSIVFCLLAACLVFMAPTSNDEPAQAVDVVNCTSLRIGTDRVEIKCTAAGIVVLDTTVNLPPGPTVQVTLPGATQTVRVNVPGPTQTSTIRVPVPGPTKSVTVSVPGPTSTVKGPTSTATVTATTTTTTGQVDNGGGTVDPSPSAEPEPDVITLPGPTTVKGAALGLLATAILAGLILLALFSGYTLGYRESDSDNATFMKRVLKKE